MQAKMVCSNCGAEAVANARFCRQCGQQINSEPRPTVTEGTTKLFESDPFTNLNEWAGPIAKPDENPTASVAGKSTQALTQKNSHTNWLIVGLAAFAAISLLTAALFFGLWRSSTGTTGPDTPAAPPKVEAPPPQPPQTVPDTAFSQLIYPGAAKTLEVNSQEEGPVVQLQTRDSAKKVADWYIAKLKPTKIVRLPAQVILESGDIKVIIMDSGEGTTIMLTLGQD